MVLKVLAHCLLNRCWIGVGQLRPAFYSRVSVLVGAVCQHLKGLKVHLVGGLSESFSHTQCNNVANTFQRVHLYATYATMCHCTKCPLEGWFINHKTEPPELLFRWCWMEYLMVMVDATASWPPLSYETPLCLPQPCSSLHKSVLVAASSDRESEKMCHWHHQQHIFYRVVKVFFFICRHGFFFF